MADEVRNVPVGISDVTQPEEVRKTLGQLSRKADEINRALSAAEATLTGASGSAPVTVDTSGGSIVVGMDIGNGLEVSGGDLQTKLGNGLEFNADSIRVKSHTGVTVDANGVSLNAGAFSSATPDTVTRLLGLGTADAFEKYSIAGVRLAMFDQTAVDEHGDATFTLTDPPVVPLFDSGFSSVDRSWEDDIKPTLDEYFAGIKTVLGTLKDKVNELILELRTQEIIGGP